MSALNFNKVFLCGRLTADPELKQTQSGISVLSFTIGVNRRVRATTDAAGQQVQPQQTADFINCVAWRERADFISRYFRKGSAIFLEGQLQVRNFTDQQGQKRYVTEVLVDEARFVDSKSDAQGYQQGGYAAQPVPAQAPAQQAPAYQQDAFSAPSFASQPDAAGSFQKLASDDDLPF